MKNKMSTLLKTGMTIFAALAFMTGTGAQTPKLRSVKYMTYEAAVNSSGKVVPGKIDRTSNRDGYYELYDNKGNTLMYSALLFSDDVYKDNVYIYDASYKLIRQDNYQNDGKELRDYWLYFYNDRGDVVEKKNFSCYDGNAKPYGTFLLEEVDNYKYDAAHHDIYSEDVNYFYDSHTHNMTNRSKYKETHRYDDAGRVLEEKRWNCSTYYNAGYTPEDEPYALIDRTLYVYDGRGNKIKEYRYSGARETYDDNGELSHLIDRKYDSRNRILEERTYFASDMTKCYRKVYTYDDAKNEKIQTSYDVEGAKTETVLHRTNAKKLDIYQQKIDYKKNERHEWTFEYTYDKYGKWVKVIIRHSGNGEKFEPQQVIVREISYY